MKHLFYIAFCFFTVCNYAQDNIIYQKPPSEILELAQKVEDLGIGIKQNVNENLNNTFFKDNSIAKIVKRIAKPVNRGFEEVWRSSLWVIISGVAKNLST